MAETTTQDEELEQVVLRFAGDSGDGMQMVGSRFTSDTALSGNDLRTLPDFPAEIRAPAGTTAGVSAFQLRFSSERISTPGDDVDVLVVMNPAALKTNLPLVKPGGTIIANVAQFTERNLKKVDYQANPLEDGSLDSYQLHTVNLSSLTEECLREMELNTRTVDRCKNAFALGLILWMYHRELEHTLAWFAERFGDKPEVLEANQKALKAGYYYGETAEAFTSRYRVKPASLPAGTYRNIAGNQALAYGLIAASLRSNMRLFLGSYPITPASDILHELSRHKDLGVATFQAEDEIAAIAAALGASYGGSLALTTSSGPGIALKGEAIGLATMLELPLVIVDVQRGGPSTGLPTKTEQADLLQALFGRNSEAPVPVIAASTPGNCFDAAYEAARIAVTYMTPVFMLSDGYLANGSEPWQIPDVDGLTPIDVQWHQDPKGFQPYARDPKTLARPRVAPGTPGLEHRVGGLEKEHLTGAVSYDPLNHELMVRLRDEKIRRIQNDIGPSPIDGPESGDILIVGWGSTRGSIEGAMKLLRAEGTEVSHLHLTHLNPMPSDVNDILGRFKTVIAPELNLGQLALVLRAQSLRNIHSICKVQGQPFRRRELADKIKSIAAGESTSPFLQPTLEHVIES